MTAIEGKDIMIDTYYIDVTQFDDEIRFREKLALLSPYRQQKTARLKHEKDKLRSLGAGVALDYALKAHGLRERNMEYEFGEWGKPSLKDYPGLHFSLSHSGNYAICSIGDRPMGNDIEFIRKGRLKVADRFYAPEELEFMYAGQEEEEIMRRMFRIWTMKESFLKATGRGISLPMGDFAVIVDEDNDKISVKHTYDAMEYHMREYRDIPGYRAAVCCREGRDIACSMNQVVL